MLSVHRKPTMLLKKSLDLLEPREYALLQRRSSGGLVLDAELGEFLHQ
jgi:hypothetical protein